MPLKDTKTILVKGSAQRSAGAVGRWLRAPSTGCGGSLSGITFRDANRAPAERKSFVRGLRQRSN
jgi:hypothetical protein